MVLPEHVLLQLPSALPTAMRSSCSFRLPHIEFRCRLAQAEDALADLRRHLRIRMGLTHYKVTQVGPSQRSSTRAQTLITRFQDRIWRIVERYRRAYQALLALDPDGDWKHRLHVLKNEDIKGLGKGDDESESTRQVSWIWRAELVGGLAIMPEDRNAMSEKDLDECTALCHDMLTGNC